MTTLKDRQREMKERDARQNVKQTPAKRELSASDDSTEALRLKTRISELEKEVETLRTEIDRLRAQKTIVIERDRTETIAEQRHNFLKYSNVRRY